MGEHCVEERQRHGLCIVVLLLCFSYTLVSTGKGYDHVEGAWSSGGDAKGESTVGGMHRFCLLVSMCLH